MSKVIVAELPGPGEGVRSIDEAAIAATIAKAGADSGADAKHESGTAAAIGKGHSDADTRSDYGTSQYRFTRPQLGSGK